MDDFDSFVRQNWDRLHAAVSRSARRYRQEPDDALQEALLRAYAKREPFESEQHAVNWICRVAHDLLCDQRRSWYGRRVTATGDLPDGVDVSAPDPADVVERRDSGRAVLRALRTLPPAHRLVLWQHAVDGRSYADIARESSRPLATVRSVALRARTAARGHLAGESSLGIGAALTLRLRLWWSRGLTPTTPTSAAALIALSLVAGGPGGHAAPDRVPLPYAGSRALSAGAVTQPAPAALAVRPSDSRPRAVAAGATAPRPVPTVPPATVPFEAVAFSGDGWGSCTLDEDVTTAITSTGTYECDVVGASTACTTVPVPLACSVSLAGPVAGEFTAVTDRVYRCHNEVTHGGELVLRVAGHAPIVIPIEFRVNDGEIHVWDETVPDLGPYQVNGRLAFVCADGPIARAPFLSGHIRPR